MTEVLGWTSSFPSPGSIESLAKQEKPLFPEEVPNRDQSKCVKFVVERVWSRLKDAPLVDAKYLNAIEYIVEHLLPLLNLKSIDVQFMRILEWVDSAKEVMQRLSTIKS